MLKKILNLKGAQTLTKNELKSINAGTPPPPPGIFDCSGWTKPVHICLKDEVCEIYTFPDGSLIGECV